MQIHDQQGLKYNLLIIGEGEEGSHLRKMAEESGVSNRIWFFGECYDDTKLNTLIYNSDLCVSPGNVGLTALHAMMYGTPVLSHDDFETQMPEYETIVPGETGMLYRHGSFEDFCDKIEEWIGSSIDREQVRRNCYKMINGRWNSEYQIQVLKSVLK
jgi:glycosyltransferase involved in cell wall biosynthesis